MKELLIELKKAYGDDADFREGQLEAIESVLNGQRLLVVQKTGWGKSLVYFLATKMIRKMSKGITLIISPLLSLMDNQANSANKLNLTVKTINSSNKQEWNSITNDLSNNKIDALIISPERLANEEFRGLFTDRLSAQISLFVIDEAHCISDWGHDFRPDYRRIIDIVNILPSNIPVLATTATANDRVVNDIKMQLGNNLEINRGSLMRESLALQVISLASRDERLAWILNNINKLPGTGIIYCLTINDCKLVKKWLYENGVSCESYYSSIDKAENKDKNDIVSSFMKNEIKVLIATVAFGMGFDKADIGFVIHYQKPGNLVAYYQQIGRAGRGIDEAKVVLLRGSDDDEINNYFIETAFPTEDLMDDIVVLITSQPGLKTHELEKYINMKPSKIKNCLKYLLVTGDIYVENKKYYKVPRPWNPDLKRSKAITEIRKKELAQIEDFTKTKDCYMKYIAEALDDHNAKTCGKCFNCVGYPPITIGVA